MRVSIQDTAGHEVAAGEVGEICVCGPAVFPGYFDDPEANAKAFRNGWFRTGDQAQRAKPMNCWSSWDAIIGAPHKWPFNSLIAFGFPARDSCSL